MRVFATLRSDQREAIGLLQIGTFLEYFDLMLYVHMAVLLNQLFFPETDPKTASLIAAFAFCSTYVMRPFGAFLFGYIGDHIGRKTTVIMTTMIMSMSCIVMANLPTYAQVGISSAWIVTLCRVAQGLSSMGEIIGAEIYLTEITKPPIRYPIVGLIGCASRFGTMIALGVTMLITSYGFNWRNGFWIGATIAVVGSVARTRLRETPDFIDMKRRIKRAIEESKEKGEEGSAEFLKINRLLRQEKIDWRTPIGYFILSSGSLVCLYFSYIYCGGLLKKIGYSGTNIIEQNFFIALVEFLAMTVTVFLSYKIHPLKIIKVKALLFLPILIIIPFFLDHVLSSASIFLVQFMSVCLALSPIPAAAVAMIHFPVYRRFTYASFTYAISRAMMAILTSFGLVYLTDLLGYWGLYFIMIPLTIAFLWGVAHFEKLEHISQKSILSKFF